MKSKKKKKDKIVGATAVVGGVTTTAGVIGLSSVSTCAVACGGAASYGIIMGTVVSLFGVGMAAFLNKYSSLLIGIGIGITILGIILVVNANKKRKSVNCCDSDDCCSPEEISENE